MLAGGGLEVPVLKKDVILLVSEWLARIVDTLLDVSEEMVDNGRGIYSKTSDILTLERSCMSSFDRTSSVCAIKDSETGVESMG